MKDTPPSGYDKLIKELMEGIEQPLIEDVLGIRADKVTRLNTLMQLTDEREVDFLAKIDCANADSFIAHVEFQSTNDPKMLKRMLRYFIHIYSLYELRVKQYVIFIGKDKMNMKTRLKLPEIRYKYKLIDMRNISCEKFLYSGVPGKIILAILCNMGGRDERELVRQILEELMKVTKGLDLSSNVRKLEMLSRLRDMQKIVIEEVGKMSIAYDLPIEKDLRFIQGKQAGKQEGLESGRVEGMQDTIELLLRMRFGEEGLSFMPKIRGYGDTSRLRSITEALIKAQDIREVEGLL
ncbi:hypothetical protein [Candidatus Magnetobacterium casense]|uniref:Transposase (putative) YhgA-like domain-containing protein n=1 Tax=Candidatus Magnetobacterium casense TaxID=1455061 RepID=A0ABS6RV91_9BACT|nr:hypothetical protein [Candidatus Magnetobacterium casensis]MBV6340549.1 hypothetical protein [Candidatus Magnetobacterium casensis]